MELGVTLSFSPRGAPGGGCFLTFPENPRRFALFPSLPPVFFGSHLQVFLHSPRWQELRFKAWPLGGRIEPGFSSVGLPGNGSRFQGCTFGVGMGVSALRHFPVRAGCGSTGQGPGSAQNWGHFQLCPRSSAVPGSRGQVQIPFWHCLWDQLR